MCFSMNWIVQRTLRGEARRLAKIMAVEYPKSKASTPDATERQVILKICFDDEGLTKIAEASRRRIEACCETVNGLCYMTALDAGRLKGWMNLRSLQFTYYMDKELEARGFPPQSYEQKERILEAMDLRIDGWDRITGDELRRPAQ